MREASLDDRKKYLLEIMDFLHDFCRKNNIQYFIFAGTLLGAARHNGFIPWDDDIDVAMKREDYDRFISLFSEQPNERFRLVDRKNTKGYYLPYAKLSHRATQLFEYVRKPIDLGINIDLFPLDHLTTDKSKALKLYDRIESLRLINSLLMTKSKSTGFLKAVARKMVRVIPQKAVLKRIDRLSRQYNGIESSFIGVISAMPKSEQIMEEESFSETILLDFEGRQYFAPIGYEAVLTHNFGNWRELPPPEKRVPHHSNDAFVEE